MKKATFLVLVLCSILLSGCGGDGLNRASVSGTVTLDGAPITDGYVTFTSEPGTSCPTVAGVIKDGSYTIPVKNGPVPGNYTVTVSASAPTGNKIKTTIMGVEKEADEMKSIVPAQYTGMAGKSPLTAAIAQGKNTVDLKLESP